MLDRADQCINICEMKFSKSEFTIEKRFAAELSNKQKAFQSDTGTRKTLFLTMITTYGVKKNDYYFGIVQNEVMMKDLFES